MARRRITEQQGRRIREAQERRLARRDEARAEDTQGAEHEGVVVAYYGTELQAENAEGRVIRCRARQNLQDLTCGDRVLFQLQDDGTGVVVAVQPRRSELRRPDYQGRMRPVAANVDQIIITAAPVPEVSTGLIDRYLVAAENVAVRAAILINKIDLLDSTGQAALRQRLEIYGAIGYPVLYASAERGLNLEQLVEQLRGHTSVFVGHSGVGKSSVIKALVPDIDVRIGALSEASGKGRHTTTLARLYHLPRGGHLIDSPGVREFALGPLTPSQVAAGFVELRPYLGACRFRDCCHRIEPGCAVLAAASAGAIDRRRLESFYRIVDSLESGSQF